MPTPLSLVSFQLSQEAGRPKEVPGDSSSCLPWGPPEKLREVGCEVREPNKKSRIWLGTFPTAEMAARAHDVAALALRGRSACLNFADSSWRLPVPASADAKDIQKAAAEAAMAFQPGGTEGFSGEIKRENKKTTEKAEATSMEDVFYMDEEAVFGMPGLLAYMAEGMLLPPPQCVEESGEDKETDAADVSLWSFSI
ncbi:hypothetical protein GH714_040218 [Hevea brasiliensis]|uniref:AP2/ERF domain-containing protein n=1 Tax=Hevea brasiliensis TaxID=3981 RepID=A0A6A6MUR7_HEVBR|nr:hypothetical protein GH714_040218 [Hevea brasiliensis]